MGEHIEPNRILQLFLELLQVREGSLGQGWQPRLISLVRREEGDDEAHLWGERGGDIFRWPATEPGL